MSFIKSLKRDTEQAERTPKQVGPDPINLWHSYKEQALLWRALALLQMPATFLAVLTAFVMFLYRDTIVEVPPKPEPGYYTVAEVPDAAFFSKATEIVNLYATYTPQNVEAQYEGMKRFFWEPLLTDFQPIAEKEISVIKKTKRTQIFTTTNMWIERLDSNVIVRLVGYGQRIIGKQPAQAKVHRFEMVMTTVPRNLINPYGIVVTSLKVDSSQDYNTPEDLK